MSDNTTREDGFVRTHHVTLTEHGTPTARVVSGDFTCPHCGLTLSGTVPGGGPRTHCPSCLHTRHDGASGCGRRMTPISIAVGRGGDWTLIHRCTGCRELTASQVHGDDNQLLLMRTAVRPLAQPPFPLEAFGEL